MVELLTGATYFIFVAAAALTVGSALSRPGAKRFEGQTYGEIVRFNPPAAFFALFARKLPMFFQLTCVSGALLVAVVTLRLLL